MRLLATLLTCAALCGCVNVNTRWPTTRTKIESCYQSTRTAVMIGIVASFPQMMSDSPSNNELRWASLVTIPFLGIPCMVDACGEAVIDTVCLPVDWPLSAARKGD